MWRHFTSVVCDPQPRNWTSLRIATGQNGRPSVHIAMKTEPKDCGDRLFRVLFQNRRLRSTSTLIFWRVGRRPQCSSGGEGIRDQLLYLSCLNRFQVMCSSLQTASFEWLYFIPQMAIKSKEFSVPGWMKIGGTEFPSVSLPVFQSSVFRGCELKHHLKSQKVHTSIFKSSKETQPSQFHKICILVLINMTCHLFLHFLGFTTNLCLAAILNPNFCNPSLWRTSDESKN